jgi:uncharacterized delta-60 repeat protein
MGTSHIGGSGFQLETLEHRRLLSDAGQLDTTFDGDGRAQMTFGAGQLIGLQPDGKIVLERQDVGGFRLARVNTNGSTDDSFKGGATLTEISGTPWFDVNPADGRIAYVVGTSKTTETQVGVFKADGSPDTSFDGDGKIVLTLGYAAQRVAWQEGKLILFGGPQATNYPYGYNKATLIRLNGDGTQDSSFGTAGKATLPSIPDTLTGLDVTADGRIVVCADYQDDSGTTFDDLRISKFTSDGKPDTTFGGGAGYIDAIASNDQYIYTQAFHVEPDGTIYHYGQDGTGFKVRRFTNNGVLNLTTPKITLPDEGSKYYPNQPRQIGVQSDGKFLLIGGGPYDYNTSQYGWLAMRFSGIDGSLDTTYGASGATFPKVQDNGRALIQSDGKLLVSGKRFTADGGNFEVLRLDTGAQDLGVVSLNSKGTLIVTGTAGADDMGVRFRNRDSRVVVWINNDSRAYAPSKIKRIALFGRAGNDTMTIGEGIRGAYIGGEDGHDTLIGGELDDIMVGGLGADKMYGNGGNDRMVGEGGNDYLLGGAGNDIMYGNGGNDTLSGAGGNDRLFGGPDDADSVLGGAGTDMAANDTKDKFDSIETLI